MLHLGSVYDLVSHVRMYIPDAYPSYVCHFVSQVEDERFGIELLAYWNADSFRVTLPHTVHI